MRLTSSGRVASRVPLISKVSVRLVSFENKSPRPIGS
jgi:hypothetical protein